MTQKSDTLRFTPWYDRHSCDSSNAPISRSHLPLTYFSCQTQIRSQCFCCSIRSQSVLCRLWQGSRTHQQSCTNPTARLHSQPVSQRCACTKRKRWGSSSGVNGILLRQPERLHTGCLLTTLTATTTITTSSSCFCCSYPCLHHWVDLHAQRSL